MSLLGKIFKKKEDKKLEGEGRKREEVSEDAVRKEKNAGGERKIIAGVIRAPHLTEKTSAAAKENKYVFSVLPKSNKIGVRQAIETRYGVKVEAVNIVNTPGKERRRGKQIGWKPGFKKAIVKIKEGQTIEIQ